LYSGPSAGRRQKGTLAIEADQERQSKTRQKKIEGFALTTSQGGKLGGSQVMEASKVARGRYATGSSNTLKKGAAQKKMAALRRYPSAGKKNEGRETRCRKAGPGTRERRPDEKTFGGKKGGAKGGVHNLGRGSQGALGNQREPLLRESGVRMIKVIRKKGKDLLPGKKAEGKDS